MPNAKRTGLLTELTAERDPGVKPDRDRLLDDAIKAGKFAESRRAHYAALYDHDPAATTRLIGRLAAVLHGGLPAESTGLLSELDA